MSFDSSITLDAQPRSTNGTASARRLRRDGFVPVTVYGGKDSTMSGAVTRREFAAILRAFGRNSIFTLNLEGAATPVKIAELQLHPVKGSLLHIDLLRISLTEKTEWEVRVETVGEPDGVRNFDGVLDQPTHTLKIRCLPTDVPMKIEADVTALGIGDHLRVTAQAIVLVRYLYSSGRSATCIVSSPRRMRKTTDLASALRSSAA